MFCYVKGKFKWSFDPSCPVFYPLNVLLTRLCSDVHRIVAHAFFIGVYDQQRDSANGTSVLK